MSCDPLGVQLSKEGKFEFQPIAMDEDVDNAWRRGGFVRFYGSPDGHGFVIVPGQLSAQSVENLRKEILGAAWKAGLDRQGKIEISVDTREFRFQDGSMGTGLKL